MSPVFRHGGLRLYLLKLLDEAPRHGYDVIRLLQDKFLGVYSPSPGTIYPRLARLEEEGLVTHETVDGKKVYRITDAGRAELNRRLDDLADLEDELAASVRDIAMEITNDVRETVRNLRDELTWAVREAGRAGRSAAAGPADAAPAGAGPTDAAPTDAAPTDAVPEGAVPEGAGGRDGAGPTPSGGEKGAWRDATAETDHVDASGEGEEPGTEKADERHAGRDTDDKAGERTGRRSWGDWRDWADWAERHDWSEWADWAKRQNWGDWTGKQDWKDRAKAGKADWAQWSQTSRPDWLKGGGFRDRREPRPDLLSDLEHLAAAFAKEIRGVARQAENVSDDAVGNLGRILFDTLNKIRTEVFRSPEPDHAQESDQPPGADQSSQDPASH